MTSAVVKESQVHSIPWEAPTRFRFVGTFRLADTPAAAQQSELIGFLTSTGLVSGLILAAQVVAHTSVLLESGKAPGQPLIPGAADCHQHGPDIRFISGGHRCLFILLPRCSSPSMKTHAVVWKMIQLVL